MSSITNMKDYLGLKEFEKNADNLIRSLCAEFIGTLMLVFVGSASTLTGFNDDFTPNSVVQIAFSFGIIVATMVLGIGHISGGHINPAVTCGMLVARRITVIRALLYIIVQCIGAICGSAILMGTIPDGLQASLGGTGLGKDVNVGQAFGIELMITFVLVFTVFAVTDGNRVDMKGSAALAIGFSVTTCHLAFVPITGSSMNPARSFGPAVIKGIFTDHWVYWAGPICGGIIAALLYSFVFRAKRQKLGDLELSTKN